MNKRWSFILLLMLVLTISAGCRIQGEVPPLAPTGFSITFLTDSSLTLVWQDTANEQGYKIYRGSTATNLSTRVATLGDGVTTYQDTGLQAGTTYFYQVVAYNNAGEGRSAIISATTEMMAPDAPTELQITSISTQEFVITWTDFSTNEQGFKIMRGTSNTDLTFTGEVGRDVTVYADPNVEPATTYFYQVVAYNEKGESAGSNIVSGTTLAEPCVPDGPTGLQAVEIESSTICLQWMDNATNELGYRVMGGTVEDSLNIITILDANMVSYKVTGLVPETVYHYQVVAFNAEGDSVGSNVVSVRTDPLPYPLPEVPTNLQVTDVTAFAVTLSWEDCSTNETGFKVLRGTSETNVSEICFVPANETSCMDCDILPNTLYYYQVVAYNAGGESTRSNMVSATTPEWILLPPTDLQVIEVTSSSVSLQWQDHSTTELAFIIQRGQNGIFADVAWVETDTTTFTDLTVKGATIYQYKVLAYDGSLYTEDSNTVTVKTPMEVSEVTGQIVDQYGMKLEGVQVTLGAYTAVTATDGRFTIPDVPLGEYPLKAKGGVAGHYLLESSVWIYQPTQSLGQLIAYQMQGVGIITESIGNLGTMSTASLASSQIFTKGDFFEEQPVNRYPHRFKSSEPMTMPNLEETISMVLLRWEAVAHQESYRVELLTEYGYAIVWNSGNAHPGDPSFDLSAPEVYLDLADELAPFIKTSGIYDFRIIGNASTGEVRVLPTVQVSLGMLLDTFPTNIQRSGDELTWSAVPGASGYRVQIYDEQGERIFSSGSTLLTESNVGVPINLTAGLYYTVKVDAHALDAETGWVSEITRGISGFVY